jgi:hypothetical protein
MNSHNTKLLTVITEVALESHLINDIEQLGGLGYTISNARGKGSRGLRSGSWEANANIRIEIICGPELAKQLAEHLQQKYYDNYAMVTFTSDVEVLRPTKFSD